MFNQSKSFEAATTIASKITKQFSASVEIFKTKKDSYVVKICSHFATKHDDNPYVLTPSNLSKVIDGDFYRLRQEGNFFSQPVKGEFEIGIK